MCGSIALRPVVVSTLRAGPSGAAEEAGRTPPSVKALAWWGPPARPAAATSSTTAADAALGVMRVGLLRGGRAEDRTGRWERSHLAHGQRAPQQCQPSRPNPAAPAAVPAGRTSCAWLHPKSLYRVA